LILTLSQLVDIANGHAIPQWLAEYVAVEREHIKADLVSDAAKHVINGPDGTVITIRRNA
jgi:hypothetical protein